MRVADPVYRGQSPGGAEWRDTVLTTVFRALIGLGLVAAIFGGAGSIAHGNLGQAVLLWATYLVGVGIVAWRLRPGTAWAGWMVGAVYAGGVAQMFYDATHIAGFMLMLTACVLSALLLSGRAAWLSFFGIVATVLVLSGLWALRDIPALPPMPIGAAWWLSSATSFSILAAASFLPLKHVVEQLSRSIDAGEADRRRLAASEARFQAIYNSVSDAIFIHEVGTGKLVDVNETTCRMFSCTKEEALTAQPDEMSLGAPPHSEAEAMEWLAKAARDGPQTFEWRSRGFDGRVFWTEVAIRRARIGEDDRLVVCVHDIDQRKRAQEAQERTEQRFRVLARSLLDVITVHDARGRVMYMTPSAERVLGWTMPSAATENPLAYLHPDDRDRVRAQFAGLVGCPGRTRRVRFRFQHIDGRWVQLEGIAQNLIADPAIRGVVVTSRDLSERHALYEQLLHAQKMESVGRLAGGVAHDFNNLLTSILGYADLAVARVEPGSDLAEWLNAVRQAGERAAELTAQLLAFARQQASQPSVVDVNAIVMETQTILKRTLGSDIEVVCRLHDGPCWARIDAAQCQQVLLNLSINARDAMPLGGTLTISTDIVDLAERDLIDEASIDAGRFVRIRVSDTGMGMDAETLAHIFEPFFTTKERGKGTGLGLATCHGIVEQSGGRITVESERNRGTTFDVDLPAVEAASPPASAPQSSGVSHVGHETVLVVEDDPSVREFFATVLRTRGYNVLAAAGGLEALRAASAHAGPIHVLLTDVVMPGVRGDALAAAIRDQRPDIAVIFTSGMGAGAGEPGSFADGSALFLQKPCRSADLAAKIREALDARQENKSSSEARG